MFEVSVEETFAAGHALRNYKGKCERVHGHNYRVRVTLEGADLDAAGLLADFADLKKILRNAIAYLDHQFINDLPPFDVINPSAENLAKYFCEQMLNGMEEGAGRAPVRVQSVRVWETDTCVATYRP
ncbi:MAG: 6-carboxytetrahydropterin synthase QueD [Acidobacteria bacterium]|nr:6-carboxytetrahydropterin synthase QueD [Acidobacteriota bacterium]